MADVERAGASPPPPSKRRRVEDGDEKSVSPPPPPPNGTDAKDLPASNGDAVPPPPPPDSEATGDLSAEGGRTPGASSSAKVESETEKAQAAATAATADFATQDGGETSAKTEDASGGVQRAVGGTEQTPYNGTAPDDVGRVPRHTTIPARDEYEPAPAPPPPAAPAPMGEYSYAAPNATSGVDGPRMPSGLTPDVDAVLERIFLSGLFERKDIDGRALDFLGSVAPNLAMAALDDIQHRDFSTVRNKPAFIMSCFKRVVAAGGSGMTQSQAPPGGYPPTSVPASALAHLPPAVSDSLQRVFASGVCHPSQFDDRAMDILVDLQERDAVQALSEFAAMEPGRVRNPSAFWMGLARKYKAQQQRDGGLGGGYGGGGGAYGSYDRGVSTGYSAVDQRIQELISSGMLPPNPLDDRAMDALRRLPEQDALSVLAEIPEPQRIRNMSAYVMGLCKKFASGEARSQASRPYGGGAYGGAGGGGAAGAYDAYGYAYGSAAAAYGYAAAAPQAQAATQAAGDGGDNRRALDAMDSAVRERFYSMVERGMLTESSFDQRAISALQTMHRDDACSALDELAASDPGRIHNISAYFMGLAKKFGGRSL